MALVPFSYNLRSMFVRKSATLLTIVSIAATVAVLCGVLALEQGFDSLFKEGGRDGILVFLRPGASSEGESYFPRDRADILIKSCSEIEEGADGRPLASAEMYLAVRLKKLDGSETNVPIRGVQQRSFDLAGEMMTFVSGRRPEQGTNEIAVGRGLAGRVQHCVEGDVLTFNTTPFQVVGVFEYDGPFRSEIWGDVDRMQEALERPIFSRVIAKMRDGVDVTAFKQRLEKDPQTPAKVMTETEYLSGQTAMLSGMLLALGAILGTVMGVAAVFTGTNTMLSAIASRTHEIGILLSVGFRRYSIFLGFLLEALLLGLFGGILGSMLSFFLNGVETGTTNWNTFTEVAFAFRITPNLLAKAVGFASLLGLLGGLWPAWRAASMKPTDAMRRQ